jgi:DDE superfamily endonuclease
MKFLLLELAHITNDQKSFLILDQYKVHVNDEIINIASEHNIELILVPVGMTHKLQPLDVGINGIVKNKSKKYIKELYMDDPFVIPTLIDAIKSLIISCNDINGNLIKSSFRKACGFIYNE